MKKQTKVLLAAAMLTLGASFSAMAAETKGTWVLNEEGWQYADKDGDYMDNVWAKSNGIEYWVNDDEVLGSNEWVQDDKGYYYYAQSDGSKTMNAWKYLYSFNDEDEENDQYWYYFDAKGRMVTGKETINGSTYHFNTNGEMLTGWVEEVVNGDEKTYEEATENSAVGSVIYTNENGAVVKSSWINVFPWTEDDGYEGEDEVWYYTTSAGKVEKNKKKDIAGLTYFFDANGAMLTEWVGKDYAGNFTEIDAADSANYAEVYFADADYGYAKKNGWRFLESADEDDEFWFHFDKLGRAFLATATDAVDATSMIFDNGETNKIDEDETVKVNSKKIDGVVYYFNTQGEMIDGLQTIDGTLYYLEDGARQTGKVTLTDENENDYTFLFGEKKDGDVQKYVAVTGAYKNYYYSKGQLITSDDKDSYKMVEAGEAGIAGNYIVDHNGKIQHKDGKDYAVVWGEGTGKYTFHADEDFITGVYVEDAE